MTIKNMEIECILKRKARSEMGFREEDGLPTPRGNIRARMRGRQNGVIVVKEVNPQPIIRNYNTPPRSANKG